MNKKYTIIVVLQALLIVTLFWVLVFYGQDEYEAYQAEQEEEIESPSRVAEVQGINVVTLPLATQRNSGIQTAKVASTTFQGEVKSFGHVVSIDRLIEAKAQYIQLQSNIQLARAGSSQKIQQYQRLKTLNDDDKNVSDLAVQESLAAVNSDKNNIHAAELQLKNLQTTVELQWGKELAKIAFSDNLAKHLAGLLNKNNVLVQISLPLNAASPLKNSTIKISPLTESSKPITAVYVSPATTSDSNGFGNTFYYSAPANLLRIGMRVNVELDPASGDEAKGVIIPSNAVVWYAGKPWAYFKNASGKQADTKNAANDFVRKPISTDTEIDAGWFNQGIEANSEVVTSGAQLLLSEEFKYLIKNENED
ncbi:MAG: hypothetical protein V4575_01970 [Pseudomonadota bacterium]